jgi:DNA-binding MarR family transcriptional regulator
MVSANMVPKTEISQIRDKIPPSKLDRLKVIQSGHMFKLLKLYSDEIAASGYPISTLVGLRVTQFVMRCYQEQIPCGTSQVAEALEIPTSTASRLLKELISVGIAESYSDPDDARRRLVRPTENGIQNGRRFQLRLLDLHEQFLLDVIKLAEDKELGGEKISPESKRAIKAMLSVVIPVALWGDDIF